MVGQMEMRKEKGKYYCKSVKIRSSGAIRERKARGKGKEERKEGWDRWE